MCLKDTIKPNNLKGNYREKNKNINKKKKQKNTFSSNNQPRKSNTAVLQSTRTSPPWFRHPFHRRWSRMVRTQTRKQTSFIPSRCYTQSRADWHSVKCYNESSSCDTAVYFLLFFLSFSSHPKGPTLAFSQSKSAVIVREREIEIKTTMMAKRKEAQVLHRKKRGNTNIL